MGNFNIWNKWDTLETCMLGNNYLPEFFNGIQDNVGDPLKRICEETLEDLEGYKKILQQFGVEVIQPEIDPSERFLDSPHLSGHPRGPLQVRDAQLVLGNDCYITGTDHPAIARSIKNYNNDVIDLVNCPMLEHSYQLVQCHVSGDWPGYPEYSANFNNQQFFKTHVWNEIQEASIGYQPFVDLNSACCMMIGDHVVYAPEPTTTIKKQALKVFSEMNPDWRIVTHEFDGHTDGSFHPLKPGAILSLYDVQTYSETFPGWDVCYLPDQSWKKVNKFLKLKKVNAGKWWLPGEEDNAEFTHFVETWLQDWVGYVEETVFDVNVLMVDEHHCCVSNPDNEQVNAFLKKHNIEPVYVPWRHRYFWDGGLHCITLDLKRKNIDK